MPPGLRWGNGNPMIEVSGSIPPVARGSPAAAGGRFAVFSIVRRIGYRWMVRRAGVVDGRTMGWSCRGSVVNVTAVRTMYEHIDTTGLPRSATLHVRKRLAAPTYTVSPHRNLDPPRQTVAPGEPAAILLRKGFAGSNTAADRIEITLQALRRLPSTDPGRRGPEGPDPDGGATDLLPVMRVTRT